MKACSLLPIWKKGKDSKKPSTRPTYAVRPVRTPSDPRGDLRLARGLTKACSPLLILKKGKDSKKPSTWPAYTVQPVRTPLGPAG